MKIRRHTFSSLTSYIVAIVLVFCVAWVTFRLVSTSLDPSSKWKTYLDNGLISNLICTVPAFLVASAFSLRSRLVIPRVSLKDNRKTFTTAQLAQQFHLHPSITPTLDGGWRAEGGGVHPHSVAQYNALVHQSFAIGAQFKAVRKEAANNYWRTGFTFRRVGGAESVTVHLDNHNLLVAYVDGQLGLRVPVSTSLENRWVLLEVDLSCTPPAETSRVFCHLNGRSWLAGEIPVADFPLSLHVRFWSDEHQRHVVLIRDISISSPIA
jgi:hypothetical protein